MNSDTDSLPIFFSVSEKYQASQINNTDGLDSTVHINIISPPTLEPYQEHILELDLNILLNEQNGHIVGETLQSLQ